jgi:hypothetical protein
VNPSPLKQKKGTHKVPFFFGGKDVMADVTQKESGVKIKMCMTKREYMALQCAAELRQLLNDILNSKKVTSGIVGRCKALGIEPDAITSPPSEGETFEDACRRISGGHIWGRVMFERLPKEVKYPAKYYKRGA